MVNDDKEKFKLADRDNNGLLTALEYVAFLYPHSYPFMHDHEVLRTLRDLDMDNDSRISFDEYIGKCKQNVFVLFRYLGFLLRFEQYYDNLKEIQQFSGTISKKF